MHTSPFPSLPPNFSFPLHHSHSILSLPFLCLPVMDLSILKSFKSHVFNLSRAVSHSFLLQSCLNLGLTPNNLTFHPRAAALKSFDSVFCILLLRKATVIMAESLHFHFVSSLCVLAMLTSGSNDALVCLRQVPLFVCFMPFQVFPYYIIHIFI